MAESMSVTVLAHELGTNLYGLRFEMASAIAS